MSERSDKAKTGKQGSWIARICVFLLIVIVGLGAGAAYFYGLPLVDQLVEERASVKTSLEELRDADRAVADTIMTEIARALEIQTKPLVEKQATDIALLSREIDRLSTSERRLTEALARAESQLSGVSDIDQKAWRWAESEFNVRMASQRLRVARDVEGALALLGAADQLLQGIVSARSDALRALIAADIADLRGLPKIDRAGLLNRLTALERQVMQLELTLIDSSKTPVSATPLRNRSDESRSLWDATLSLLSSYFVVTTIESSETRPLTSDWKQLAEIALRVMFEEARLALWIGDQQQFRASLSRAEAFVRSYAAPDSARADSIIKGLTEMATVDLMPKLPDLSETQRAFRVEMPSDPYLNVTAEGVETL